MAMPGRTVIHRVVPAARGVFEYATEHSLMLPFGAILALTWVNVAAESYIRLTHVLEFPINDIGMVFFFALATKEVVEATSPGGALHTWRRAALPCVAAVGGMAAPASLYLGYAAVVGEAALRRGWAIPCVTDIAFSYLVANANFRRHPAIPFLLLLAIADDAFGLVVLAVFYPVRELNLIAGSALLAAGLAVAFALRRGGVTSFWPYIFGGGILSWLALFDGGLHPALALVPIVPFLPRAARDPGLFVEAPAAARDALSEFEHWWKYPMQAILFLFGLVNAGVPINSSGPATWAVLSAILIGKPLGISLAVGASVVAGFKLPPRLDWRDVVVTGCAAGIGFTVALFFATAAFPPGRLLDESKLGALLSVGSAGIAFAAAAALRVGRFRASRAGRP
jgi:Na+:H+ antiporter, NhaA family